MSLKKWLVPGLMVAIGVAVASSLWQNFGGAQLPDGFAMSNGRIEAVEIDVATKSPGRITEILFDEGDFVTAGQVIARMETNTLSAQLKEAEASLAQAVSSVTSAEGLVRQRESEKAAAVSLIAQRDAELDAASRRLKRTESLAEQSATTEQQRDTDRASFHAAEAAMNAAKAQAAAADAAIATARSQVIGAQAQVEAARATIVRIQVDLDDCQLKSPRDGRIQYRVSQPGEVLGAGGKVLNLLDLADVYMTLFLPTAQAGRVQMGADARIVLDAAPHIVIPAKITFVASEAQFTPKTVETAEERLKLMFRLKARIAPELLKQHLKRVKTGLPGVAYVQLDPQAVWPEHLEVKLAE
ncbi:Multidrug resistance protein MdtN [Caulifigura coniformis]|uniref:Multidrug resistance protein MdtN n=1 Tax=Caulifigura coniformis TaxID=2527983 RepID=A0A517SAA9_9PLAN|nr:HlyD family efflux transporter periplasmic adaptor subunit [Caulifigura coniformis]QDT53071.1 Multidrug resistance protein MdtN [Caulifigura coniformis]